MEYDNGPKNTPDTGVATEVAGSASVESGHLRAIALDPETTSPVADAMDKKGMAGGGTFASEPTAETYEGGSQVSGNVVTAADYDADVARTSVESDAMRASTSTIPHRINMTGGDSVEVTVGYGKDGTYSYQQGEAVAA